MRRTPKIVTIHQPNYLPWIGLFSKASQANCFIVNDTAQYVSSGVTNRNKVRTRAGWCYLTVPVDHSFYDARIIDVLLPPDRKWREKHWQTICCNYARTRFFKDHAPFFEQLYREDFDYLWQINEKVFLYLLDCFRIEVEVLKYSQMDVDPRLKKTDLVVACLQQAGADIYLSGPSGKKYLEVEKFARNHIALEFSRFEHPTYRQRYPGFEPNMSAIDLLFNRGTQAADIIRDSASVEIWEHEKSLVLAR